MLTLDIRPTFSHSHRFSFAHVQALPTLALNRLLAFAASSVIGIFFPIFLYEFFHASITSVLIFYLFDQAIKFPFYVFGAKIFSKIGLTKSMMLGVLGLATFYLSFFFVSFGKTTHPLALMAVALFGVMLTSTLYWSPFHIDFAEFLSKEKRGRQMGLYFAIQRFVGVLAPAVAGLIILLYGYYATFFLGLILVLCSLIPLSFLPRHDVKFEFGYLESFKKLFSKQFRSMSISMMALGAENTVGVVVWPIFLYAVFKGNHLEIGVFSTVIIAISIFLELFVGKETDKFSARRMLKFGTILYTLGWIWKGLVQTVVGVFAASTFHSIGSIFLQTPMDALMYEQAADSGHYIDEYTVLREMSLNIGRLLMFVVLLGITRYFSIGVSFFAAAAISLLVNRLSEYRTT
jgi:MFS family permease